MEFENILEQVGSYGPFQRNFLFFFITPVAVLAPLFSVSLIFVVTVPNHWCNVQNVSQRVEKSHCLMYDLADNYTMDTTKTVSCTNGWEYDKSHFDDTAATKWNMVCNDSHYPNLILTLQNVGSLIGTPVYGSMADRFGRKNTFFISVFVTLLSEIFSIVTPSFILFAICKTINGAIIPTIVSIPYILVSELVGPDKRVFVGGVLNIGWMIGMCVLPLIVYIARSWITLGIINIVLGIALMLYWKYLPESPVWLLSRERYDEAFSIMKGIGVKNNRIPDDAILYKKLKALGEKVKMKKDEDKQNIISSITRYPRLRTIFLIITFCWTSNIATYTGLQYNVTNLQGNEFLNFFLLSVVEAPGNVLFWILMERVGRRWTACGGFFASGLICLISLTGLPYCEIVSSVLGKLLISGVFMVTDQQACELYPTVARSSLIGISKTLCKLITFLVPYLIYLGMYSKAIPFIAFSLLCFVSGIVTSFLPETLNENLPQNMSDTEELGRNSKFFSFNRKAREIRSPSTKSTNNDDQARVFVIEDFKQPN